MDKSELTRKLTLGGPVRYRKLRGHVVAMNDLNQTVTIELNGLNYPNVPYEDVKPYNANTLSLDESRRINLACEKEYEQLKANRAGQQALNTCLRKWHEEGVGVSFLSMVSGSTKQKLKKRGII